MRLEDFIDACNRATSAVEVFQLFQIAAAELGFDQLMYRALRNHPDTQLPCTARSYPDEWIDHYVSKGYVDSDPVRLRCLVSNGPFAWWDCVKDKKDPAGLIFNEAADVGLKDGVAVPIHGPGGMCVGVGFASSAGGIDTAHALPRLQVMAVQFHTAYSALVQAESIPRIHLTPREKEILAWSGQGKSAWAIGQILSISEHSVEWHLKNCFRKLGVDSRITAVVKALHLGLIGL